MLTTGQIGHFKTFGFLVLRQRFTSDEIATMKREAEEIYVEDRGGKPLGDKEPQDAQPFFERKPFLSTLADDDRLYNVGEELLGPDFVLDGTEGRLRVGPTPWHGAIPEENAVRTVKINIYPDPLTKDTGCLRVIPGSHRVASPDPFAQLRPMKDAPDFRPFGVAPAEVPCVPLEVEPGDIIVFQESVLHSSFGGRPGRHQLAINFFANPTTDVQVKEIADAYRATKWSFRPARSYINSDRPRIRRMVSRLVEWGFEPLEY